MINRIQDKILYENYGTLSDRELLEIVLKNGEAAKVLLQTYETLGGIYKASAKELMKIKGLGKSRVALFKAFVEMNRRVLGEKAKRGRRLLCPQDVFNTIWPMVRMEHREIFLILVLDAKNRLIKEPIPLSIGSSISTVVHPKEVLAAIVKTEAVSAIIVHNHPSSGDPEPSKEDIELSARLKKLSDLLGTPILDHIVIGECGYVSFMERRLW